LGIASFLIRPPTRRIPQSPFDRATSPLLQRLVTPYISSTVSGGLFFSPIPLSCFLSPPLPNHHPSLAPVVYRYSFNCLTLFFSCLVVPTYKSLSSFKYIWPLPRPPADLRGRQFCHNSSFATLPTGVSNPKRPPPR